MSAQIRSAYGNILMAVQTQLIAKTDYGAERVQITDQPEDMPYPQGTQDLLIWVRGLAVPIPPVDGSGRTDTRLVRKLSIVVRTFQRRDETQARSSWFLDTADGHLQLEEAVVNALQLFMPADAQGNQLVGEPMRLIGGSDYRRDRREPDWGVSTLDFEVMYEINLDQSIL